MMANLQTRKHRLLGVDETKNLEQAVNNIVYNTPTTNGGPHRHILQALVTDEPGVLRFSFPTSQNNVPQQTPNCKLNNNTPFSANSKVSGVLAARGFNIDSLVVSSTEVKSLSRMTIVLRGADTNVEQVPQKQNIPLSLHLKISDSLSSFPSLFPLCDVG